MSAFVVDKAHIDVIVFAGLRAPAVSLQGGKLHWYARDPDRVYAEAGGGDAGWEEMGKARRELNPETVNRVGQMMLDENLRSVFHRYPDTLEGGCVPGSIDEEWREPYRYRYPMRWGFNAVEALAAINSLEYQSCEHPEWDDSEAHTFCEALTGSLIRALPGYAEAPWEFTDSMVHANVRQGDRLVINLCPRAVRVDGHEIHLAPKEFDLLAFLAMEPERVFTKGELLRDVWGFAGYARTRTVDNHASRLRRKLAEHGVHAVENVWGVGYKFGEAA